jgi:hypothetical protein
MPDTSTENTQLADAASVAPLRLTVLSLAVAAIVPPHEPLKPLGVATTSPAGRSSVKPIPERRGGGIPRLATLKVKVVLPVRGSRAVPNAFAMVGGDSCGPAGSLSMIASSAARAAQRRAARRVAQDQEGPFQALEDGVIGDGHGEGLVGSVAVGPVEGARARRVVAARHGRSAAVVVVDGHAPAVPPTRDTVIVARPPPSPIR